MFPFPGGTHCCNIRPARRLGESLLQHSLLQHIVATFARFVDWVSQSNPLLWLTQPRLNRFCAYFFDLQVGFRPLIYQRLSPAEQREVEKRLGATQNTNLHTHIFLSLVTHA